MYIIGNASTYTVIGSILIYALTLYYDTAYCVGDVKHMWKLKVGAYMYHKGSNGILEI